MIDAFKAFNRLLFNLLFLFSQFDTVRHLFT